MINKAFKEFIVEAEERSNVVDTVKIGRDPKTQIVFTRTDEGVVGIEVPGKNLGPVFIFSKEKKEIIRLIQGK